jgi:hypothetical protein
MKGEVTMFTVKSILSAIGLFVVKAVINYLENKKRRSKA